MWTVSLFVKPALRKPNSYLRILINFCQYFLLKDTLYLLGGFIQVVYQKELEKTELEREYPAFPGARAAQVMHLL